MLISGRGTMVTSTVAVSVMHDHGSLAANLKTLLPVISHSLASLSGCVTP